MHVCMYVCTHIYIYIMCVYVYIYIYLSLSIYIYIYTLHELPEAPTQLIFFSFIKPSETHLS